MRMLRTLLPFAICLLMIGCPKGCTDEELALQFQDLTFTRQISQKLDILWVLDISGSMAQENQLVQNGMSDFVTQLATTNADINMGFISMHVKELTDPTAAEQSGLLQAAPGVDQILNNITLGGAFVTDAISTLNYLQNDPPSSPEITAITGKGCEMGMQSAYLALNSDLDRNPGFLRADAALAVIFVTDEDDASTNPQVDDLCEEGSLVYSQTLTTVNEYVRFFQNLKGTNFTLNGILTIDKDDPGCAAVNPLENSTDFIAAIGATAGFVGDICESDYTTFIDELGLSIAELINTFDITIPADTTTLEVYLNGSLLSEPAEYTYNKSEGKLVINTLAVTLDQGDTVQIRYSPDPSGLVLAP